jgi:hypothetical protein
MTEGARDADDLLTVGDSLRAEERDVQTFIDRAIEEISSLRKQLSFTENLNQRLERSAGAADDLRRLVDQQADEILDLQSVLQSVTSLCDLAEWSADSTGASALPSLLVQDVRRAVAGRVSR